MKAEHRKELETNLLADRMGRLVQRMKTRPQRRTLQIALLAGVVALAVLVWWNFIREDTRAVTTLRWEVLEKGYRFGGKGELTMDPLAGFQLDFAKGSEKGPFKRLFPYTYPSDFDNPGKAARLEVARYCLWDFGVKRLGRPLQPETFEGLTREPFYGLTPLERIELAAKLYDQVLEHCENEPEWKAEALYGLAVIDETRALQDISMLAEAKKKYKSLADTLPKTGHGKLADKRYKDLTARDAEVTLFYATMKTELEMPLLPPKKTPRVGGIP